LIGANNLIVERLDDRRKKPVEAETFALVSGEGGSFVEGRIVKQIHAPKADGANHTSLRYFARRHCCEIVSLSRREAGQGGGAKKEEVELDTGIGSLLNAVEPLWS
jgi:hypothetical protein